VKLGGSLREPAVTVDAPSALLASGFAVATGGVSLLGKGLLDRVVSEAAACSPAIASANAPLFALIINRKQKC